MVGNTHTGPVQVALAAFIDAQKNKKNKKNTYLADVPRSVLSMPNGSCLKGDYKSAQCP